jgi:hypothetical protein
VDDVGSQRAGLPVRPGCRLAAVRRRAGRWRPRALGARDRTLGQGERERAAAARAAVDLDAPAHRHGEPLGDGQPEPRPRHAARRGEALEGQEEQLRVGRRDARARVGDGDADARPVARPRGDDGDLPAGQVVLDRVGEQVDEDLPQPLGVGVQAQARVDAALDPELPLGGVRGHERERVVDHLRERDLRGAQAELALLDARDVQDLVDEPHEMLAGLRDVVQALPVAPVVLELEELGEAEDGVERRAQLVAHPRQEAVLGLRGALDGRHLARPRRLEARHEAGDEAVGAVGDLARGERLGRDAGRGPAGPHRRGPGALRATASRTTCQRRLGDVGVEAPRGPRRAGRSRRRAARRGCPGRSPESRPAERDRQARGRARGRTTPG